MRQVVGQAVGLLVRRGRPRTGANGGEPGRSEPVLARQAEVPEMVRIGLFEDLTSRQRTDRLGYEVHRPYHAGPCR